MQESKQETVLFVGSHPDDIEIGCGGTVQVFRDHGFRVVGQIITVDPERDKVAEKTAKLLGYELVLGGVSSKEVEENVVASLVRKTLEQYKPSIVFGHSPDDDHWTHRVVSAGTDSVCRGVPNFLYFCGPMRKTSFSYNTFFTFWKEQQEVKHQVLQLMKKAYEPTHYFTEEYLTEALFLGQRVYQYKDRAHAPHILVDGVKRIPYVEGFVVQRLLDPFFPTSIARNSEFQVPR